jgi:hypothetical protein
MGMGLSVSRSTIESWRYEEFVRVRGAALVPRLIAALGTQRDRYHSASELEC